MPGNTSRDCLQVSDLRKGFGTGQERVQVLNGINLNVREGEFVSVFGPNGCGKTTLLNLLAGIMHPDSGHIIHNTKKGGSRIGMVFQDYDKTLFPWRRCIDNIVLPMESEDNLTRRERRRRVRNKLDELGLTLPLDNFPYEMSGGQKQLTSLARAMVVGPSLLLMDEPFASLDYQTRMNMHETLQNIWMKTRITTILVSHEIDEAIYLSDRLLLLSPTPTKVAEEYLIPITRPRTLASVSTSGFVELRASILKRFTDLVTI